MTPRADRMLREERAALESDIAKFREHADDSEGEEDDFFKPAWLNDSDVEDDDSEEVKDCEIKASLKPAKSRLRGTCTGSPIALCRYAICC